VTILKSIQVDFDDSSYQIAIGRNILDQVANLTAEKTKNKKILIWLMFFLKQQPSNIFRAYMKTVVTKYSVQR